MQERAGGDTRKCKTVLGWEWEKERGVVRKEYPNTAYMTLSHKGNFTFSDTLFKICSFKQCLLNADYVLGTVLDTRDK